MLLSGDGDFEQNVYGEGRLGENEKLDRTGKENTPRNTRKCALVTEVRNGEADADSVKMVENGIKVLKGR